MHAPRLLLVLCAALVPVLAFADDSPRSAALTKAQQTILRDSVIPAHQAGDPAALLAALSPAVARMSEAHVKAADALLAEAGVPPVAELLIHHRLALIEQNRAVGLMPPQGRELLLTIRGLVDRIEGLLAERGTHPAFADTKPGSLAEYEKNLWGMHVLANRLENTARLTRYGEQLAQGIKKLDPKSLSDEVRELLATDFAGLYRQLEDMHRELAERTVESRVNRIAYADEVLTKSSDIKERFQAAFWLELDGEELAKFFERLHAPQPQPAAAAAAAKARSAVDAAEERQKPADDPAADLLAGNSTAVKFRQSLADPNLPETIREHVKHGLQTAGKDFVQKSRLLFTGLHWWFRGRYGMGTDGNGLLKSKLALTSPDAQFGLYLPRETPQPTDPRQAGRQVPQVDRRHHYVWQFETRTIQTSFQTSTKTDRDSDTKVNQVTTFDRFY